MEEFDLNKLRDILGNGADDDSLSLLNEAMELIATDYDMILNGEKPDDASSVMTIPMIYILNMKGEVPDELPPIVSKALYAVPYLVMRVNSETFINSMVLSNMLKEAMMAGVIAGAALANGKLDNEDAAYVNDACDYLVRIIHENENTDS